MTDSIEKLAEEFARFPGVGPRQAKRFAYYLLTRSEIKLRALVGMMLKARKAIVHCPSCWRLSTRSGKSNLCSICADNVRDNSLLMVVGHDVDIESIEKSGSYRGNYFVLGGTIPVLDEKPEERVRLSMLKKQVNNRAGKGLSEIILALDLNPDGEHTMEYLSSFLNPLLKNTSVKISHLGRGLSTGTELQYSDPETIKNALKNRASTP